MESHIPPKGVPIPGTGRCHMRGYCGHRYPQTSWHRRGVASLEVAAADININPATIGGAGYAHPYPTGWDDIPRREQRSWKSHRQQQYKPASESRGGHAT